MKSSLLSLPLKRLVSKLLPMLVLLPLTACSATLSTATNNLDTSVTTGVCSVWVAIPYASKHDTAETVKNVRGNNAARAAYCNGVTSSK